MKSISRALAQQLNPLVGIGKSDTISLVTQVLHAMHNGEEQDATLVRLTAGMAAAALEFEAVGGEA